MLPKIVGIITPKKSVQITKTQYGLIIYEVRPRLVQIKQDLKTLLSIPCCLARAVGGSYLRILVLRDALTISTAKVAAVRKSQPV